MNIHHVTEDTVITTKASMTFPNGRYRHGIGFVAKGDEGTRLDGGPKVPGPWGFAYGLSTVVTSHPACGSGYESAKGRANGTEFAVKTGDLLVFEDVIYQVETYRYEEFVWLHRMDLRKNRADVQSRKYAFQIEIEKAERAAKRDAKEGAAWISATEARRAAGEDAFTAEGGERAERVAIQTTRERATTIEAKNASLGRG